METIEMAGITRISRLYNTKGRPGLFGISRSTFFDNFVLHSEADPYIPRTNVRRLRLLHLAPNAAAAFKDEVAENTVRKDFALSEAVAIKRELEPLEKAAAKERQGARTDKHPGKLPTSSKGRAADKAAKATGMARRTLEKAEAIVDAAEA